MSTSVRIPFRLRILIAVLFMVTAVVSFITFTMAKMFQEDKAAYVSDLASIIAVNAAEEASIVLGGCRDRLVAFDRQFGDARQGPDRSAATMYREMAGIKGLLAVQFKGGKGTATSIVDSVAVRQGGVDPARFRQQLDEDALASENMAMGTTRIVNSTLSSKLSTLTFSVALHGTAGGPARRIIGVFDQGRVLSLGRASKAFEVFLTEPDGHVVSHGNSKLVFTHTRFTWVPQLTEGSLAVVKTYSRNDVQMVGGFARVGIGELVAGAQIPRSAAFFATRRLLRDLMLVALGLLMAVAVLTLLWSGTITRSLERLAEAAQVIGRGDFRARVAVTGNDEMGQLAGSFNQMAEELLGREQALQQAQMALIQSEKLAAFGQLGAGIAHEVKNPLAGIQGLVQLTARGLKPEDPLMTTLATIEKETKRCRTIIDNLLKFARPEKLATEPVEIGAVIADTDAILRHQMSLHDVELRTYVSEGLPKLMGSANQLQQVLMNLALNAEQAITETGRNGVVEIHAAATGGDSIELRVKDDGPGMPAHIARRVFEPFFSTKPTGKGTGLGLSVTFGIVREHGGTIRVETAEGAGTTFIIVLPVSAVSTVRPVLLLGDEPEQLAA